MPTACLSRLAILNVANAGWIPPPKPKQSAFFCKMCGKPLELRIPAGEHEWRHACTECGFIDYSNPKMVQSYFLYHLKPQTAAFF